MKKVVDFLQEGIWRMRFRTLERKHYFLLRPLRVLLLAIRGFNEDRCQLRASALTFYSLLSIVPVFALAFGVAKGFGMDAKLNAVIAENMQGQEAVVGRIIEFSQNMLANTRGGVVGGIGVVLLFWAVIKVLGNIEQSFNAVWGIKRSRTFSRKVSDYLSVMMICPVLLIFSSSATVFVTSQVVLLADKLAFLGPVQQLVLASLKIVPYLVIWSVCTFLYLFMPNTKVTWKSGISAGIVAGTLFQLLQWAYVFFQVGVSKYNAIYGSFAALPLFLMWLQLSWLVILFGAELSFAVDNDETYEFEKDCQAVSPQFRMLVALRITQMLSKRFTQDPQPMKAIDIAHTLEAPIRLVRDVLEDLVEAGLISCTSGTQEFQESYQPARDIHQLTVHKVIKSLRQAGKDPTGMINEASIRQLKKALDGLDAHISKAPQNRLLIDIGDQEAGNDPAVAENAG